MLQLLNKTFLLLYAICLFSCGFLDLRPIGVGIEPDKVNAILPELYTPVIIKFDTEMIQNETEGILHINSDLGSVKGDKYWKGNHLYFVPIAGWTAGIRYTLSLIGTMRSVDGRETRVERFVTFYAINNNAPPSLETFSPENGASIGININTFEFCFSRPMDRLSVESSLTIEGIGNKKFEWSIDDKSVKIISEKTLSPWMVYRWNIRESAKSKDGVPLPKTYTGYFTTDLNQILPCVLEIYPVLYADGCWYPTGAKIETGLRGDQAVAVKFNKPMGENVLRSMRFEPSLPGRVEYLCENSVVYIFSREPEPEIEYTLIISGETKDNEGLKIGSDYRINFTPDILYLKVLSLTANGKVYTLDTNDVVKINVDPGTGYVIFSIHFSLLFDFEELINTPQRITLNPFFPRSLSPATLQYLYWTSDDLLLTRWEGLTAGDDETPHYYKLTIPGGRGGISCGSNIFMKEDLIIFLEAVK
ncbi:MAG: Ig-like domain-containing protein [Treponema sp.]|nr:Ig-like domain-containing protein [Treponema sp.]